MLSRLPRFLACLLLLALAIGALTIVGCSDTGGDEFIYGTLTWRFIDRCDDGNGVQIVIFDEDSDDVWPLDGGVFVIEPGQEEFINTVCEQGNLLCYGARTDPDTGIFWGIDIDGGEDCTDCCWECDDIIAGPIELLCENAKTVRGR